MSGIARIPVLRQKELVQQPVDLQQPFAVELDLLAFD
jgi:hypothetical protein